MKIVVWRDAFVESPCEEDGFSSYLWSSRRNNQKENNRITSIDIPENESKRDQIDEGVNLQNPKEKQPEMLEHLQKEIPEQADIGAEIGNVQSKRKM